MMESWKTFNRPHTPDAHDSGILVEVPSKLKRLIFLWVIATAQALAAQAPTVQAPAAPAQTAPPAASAQPQQQTPPAPVQAAPEPAAAPQKSLAIVVLDPGHGGADAGARGSTGIAESDVVLSYARLMRISLEAQGIRVVLTRQANDDPSFDDRSRIANAPRGAIFITLHVSSTGQPGTVRVYSMPKIALPQNAATTHGGLLSWDRAQFGYIEQSRKLAELIQIQMAQRFHGSSETPFEAPIRQLRTVAAPAVAIEVSSVSIPDRAPLNQMGPGLADGVARAVAAFRTIYESGGN
jgi:N-acetylmuramoyl-L-alanine amidase